MRKQGCVNMNKINKKFSTGAISATVWDNETVKDGETVKFQTISIDRRYKDEKDEWKSTSSFRIQDLPKTALVANKAFEYLTLQEN